MKKLTLIISLSLYSMLSFGQSKVGTIDAEYILNQLPEMTQVNQGLKEYQAELQAGLDTTIVQYETLVTDYQKNSTSYTEEKRKELEREIFSLENNIKGFRQKAGVMMQIKRNELTQPLYKKINTAMLQVIQEQGYSHVLHAGGNTLAFSSEKFDITKDVLKKLGISTQD